MDDNKYYREILNIDKKSPARKAGIKKGDIIISINNESIIDFIDDNYFNSLENLDLRIIRRNKEMLFHIQKDDVTPLGINYKDDLYPDEKCCENGCIFCFVDQLPKSMRHSLYVKDDDWRYSIAFGNFVTLTNVSENDIQRIIRRKASPLYISVHATNPEVRVKMMKNKHSGDIADIMKRLAENKILMHTQIVLCPNINDGAALDESIDFLAALYPQVRSLAVVPVGMTNHRMGLDKVDEVDKVKAIEVLDQIKTYATKFIETISTEFVYASDEFYQRAGYEYPRYTGGDHNAQLSNGVGMFGQLLDEFEESIKENYDKLSQINTDMKITMITATSAYKKINEMANTINDITISSNIKVIKVINTVFGDKITVSGLLCGKDIYEALKDKTCDVIIIPCSTLGSKGDMFLDNMTLEELSKKLDKKIISQEIDGYEIINTILNINT